MKGYKTCPECGAEHKLRIPTCGCGYTWGKYNEGPAHDPMHGCCSYMAGTSRCHYPGSFSDSLKGDGTWYCAKHQETRDPLEADRIVHDSHEEIPRPDYSIQAIRRRSELAFLKKFHAYTGNRPTKFNPSTPGKDWAHRVLEREAQGEQLPWIAVSFAKEVVNQQEQAA